MIWLLIEELKAGMILAEAVYSHQEVLLLGAGARITKKNIRMFKSWGINRVFVKGELPPSRNPGEAVEREVSESTETALKAKFSDVLDDPVMVEIFKAANKALTRRRQNSEKENAQA